MRRPLLALIAGLALAGAAAQAQSPAPPQPGGIDAGRLSEHVKILSSDAFEGRGPATEGEKKTLAYLIGQFSAIGL
jgi:hypothetical protein